MPKYGNLSASPSAVVRDRVSSAFRSRNTPSATPFCHIRTSAVGSILPLGTAAEAKNCRKSRFFNTLILNDLQNAAMSRKFRP
ncbi:MAG: hypothetical protein J1F25_01390 [Prevotellaceae bacterium]|nr:hypothetical protein [Prevotellaceae bacterium]